MYASGSWYSVPVWVICLSRVGDVREPGEAEWLARLLSRFPKTQYPERAPSPEVPGGVGLESSRYGKWLLGDFDPRDLPYAVPPSGEEFSMEACEVEARSPYSENVFFVSGRVFESDVKDLKKAFGAVRDPADWGTCIMRPVERIDFYTSGAADRLDVTVKAAGRSWVIRNVSILDISGDVELESEWFTFVSKENDERSRLYDERTRGYVSPVYEQPYPSFGAMIHFKSRHLRGHEVWVERDLVTDAYKLRVRLPVHERMAFGERELW